MNIEEKKELAKLFASKFIARPDVHAIQWPNGEWRPVQEKFTMDLLLMHLAGEISIGHYMLNPEGNVKLFAFDIDLEKANAERGIYWPIPGRLDDEAGEWVDFTPGDPRLSWESLGSSPEFLRDFLVYQLRSCAARIARTVEELLGVSTCISYSGHKGLHVYCFTGLISAAEAREAAKIVLDHTGVFQVARGNNFYKGIPRLNSDIDPWPQLSIEIFPKQESVSPSGFGNLMRLPLGRHLRAHKDHPYPNAFFIDPRWGYSKLVERNALEALTTENQWAGDPTRV
jgi:hypothetical protein